MSARAAPRVALLTYSTKPRGGVIHTLALAEALTERGVSVQVVALGDREAGFFRDVAAPYSLIAAPAALPTLEERVFASVDALETGLREIAADLDILHSQDCISARAAARIRDAGAPVTVLRTVHHVDDFTTQALIDCQRHAILEPDQLIVVSEDWRSRLRTEYGVESRVIHNGVDAKRFSPISRVERADLRAQTGVTGRFVFLAVGGIEPRKGTLHLFQAMAELARERVDPPVLVIIGGHSFQDYTAYREHALGVLSESGLVLGRDVIQAGTVSELTLRHWYRSADALVFPSLKEGWGLAVLEAMAADLPVVASDIPVLREYLTDGVDAVLTTAGDAAALAKGMRAVMDDPALRERLRSGGREVVSRYPWEHAAAEHERVYRSAIRHFG